MWEREFFYVFKVWSEVSPQAELCLPPEEEAQDRPGDRGPVRQLRPGPVPGQQPAGRGPRALGELRDSAVTSRAGPASPVLTTIIIIIASLTSYKLQAESDIELEIMYFS